MAGPHCCLGPHFQHRYQPTSTDFDPFGQEFISLYSLSIWNQSELTSSYRLERKRGRANVNWVTHSFLCALDARGGKWSCSKPHDLGGRNLQNICSSRRESREGWRWGEVEEEKADIHILSQHLVINFTEKHLYVWSTVRIGGFYSQL